MKDDLLRIQQEFRGLARAALLFDVHAAIKAARRVAALFDAGEFDAADLLWSEDGPRPALVRLFTEFNNGGQVHERETVRKLLESLHPKSPNQSHGQVVRNCCDAVLELIPEADNAEYLKQRTSDVGGMVTTPAETLADIVIGVSLLDAALTLNDGDEDLAREKKSSWQKLRDPKMPESIGNCPNHRQVKLFAPSAICDFIEKVEGKPLCQKYGIRKALLEKSRPPRPE